MTRKITLVLLAVAALGVLAQPSQAGVYSWNTWTAVWPGNSAFAWTDTNRWLIGGVAGVSYPGQTGSTDQITLEVGKLSKISILHGIQVTVASVTVPTTSLSGMRWRLYGQVSTTNPIVAIENSAYYLNVTNSFIVDNQYASGAETQVWLNLTGNGYVSVINSGGLNLSHANTYAGTTTVQHAGAGTSVLMLNANGALGTGAVTIGSATGGAGALQFGTTPQTQAGYITSPVDSAYNHAVPAITVNATGEVRMTPGASGTDLDLAINGGKIYSQSATNVTPDWTYAGDLTFGAAGGTFGQTTGTNSVVVVGTFTGDLIGDDILAVNARNANAADTIVAMAHANASFTGDWDVTSGILRIAALNALGTGVVDVAVASSAFLDLAANQTVYSLTIGGTPLAPGTYTSGSGYSQLTGAGQITVVPEPASLALLGLGGVMVLIRRRR